MSSNIKAKSMMEIVSWEWRFWWNLMMLPVQLPTWKTLGRWLNKAIKHPRATGTNFSVGSKFIRPLNVSYSPFFRKLLGSLLPSNPISWMLPMILWLAFLKLPTIQWLMAGVSAMTHIGLTTMIQVVPRSPAAIALRR
jgi:hypothetical protein